MQRLMRAISVFLTTTLLSTVVLTLAAQERHAGSAPMVAAAASSSGYSLTDLVLLRESIKYVQEGYVDPTRIEPDRMFDAALESVERLIPEVLLRRDGSNLTMRIGTWRSTIYSPVIRRLDELPAALAPVAVALRQHLDPADIIDPDAHIEPLAMVEYAMVNGLLATLDPHSSILPPEATRDMDVENRGEFGGLGINIVMEEGRLIIEYPMPGTPAFKAGLRDGDIIRRIDGEPTVNMSLDEAIEILRGPVGRSVALEIIRSGLAAPFEVAVQRANIQLSPVEAFALGGGYGYVRIRTFHATVAGDLKEELTAMSRSEGGLRGLILDLRDNPGGYLTQAIGVADLFLREGEIVSTVGPHDVRPNAEMAEETDTLEPFPLVVLVDANSASASEIVAGALRNNERAVIVGERTFGKGSVQNLHGMPYESKLKLTVAQYLTPGDRSIQSVGIPADIELVPTWIGMRRLGDEMVPAVSLSSRERLRREADLDVHLDNVSVGPVQPVWSFRCFEAWEGPERRPYDPPDPSTDNEVGFALALLQSSPGSRRPEMLEGATRLVRQQRLLHDGRITAAMAGIGVDWRAGPDPGSVVTADVAIDLDLGPDGILTAGQAEDVRLTLHNRGREPLARIYVVAKGHPLLDGAEFALGWVPPGEERSFAVRIRPDDGYPTERSPAELSVRDGSGRELTRGRVIVETRERSRPELAWTWAVVNPTDGSVDPGDTIKLAVEVENIGRGATRAATLRIKNGSDRALDLSTATLEPGLPRNTEGEVCPVEHGCRPTLLPGERWRGEFEVRVLEARSSGYRLRLAVGDADAYDHAAVVDGGLYGWTRQEEDITFMLGPQAGPTAWRRPPHIDITLAPALEVSSDLVTLSGRATDDVAVDRVMIFVGEDKLFFQGSEADQAITAVPFSADAWLKPGRNTLSVVVTDDQGFSSTVSRVVYVTEDTLQAMAPR